MRIERLHIDFAGPRSGGLIRVGGWELHVSDEVYPALAMGKHLAGVQLLLAGDHPRLSGCSVRKDLRTVYMSVSAPQLVVTALLGMGWGLGNVLFGLSIARLGLALGYAIIMGSVAVLGTLLPWVVQSRGPLLSGNGVIVLSGVAFMAAGIAVSGWAGRARELAVSSPGGRARDGSYGISLLLAIGSGFLAPMLNYSFVWGHPIATAAVRLGNSSIWAGYAVWPVTLLGGFLTNSAYCVFLLWKNHTWALFQAPHRDAGAAAVMAALWMGSLSLYGMAATWLGPLGTSLGWGLVQAVAIIAANASGLWSGEWAASPHRARRLLFVGIALLTLATVVMAIGNRAQTSALAIK